MAEITLPVESGRPKGSRNSGRLRAAGKVPGVVYGHGIEPLSVAVDARALRAALSTEAGMNALLTLQVGGASHLTMARELQRHPVRHTVTHVDFQVVRRDEVMAAEVPIALVGDAVEVHKGDGVVDQALFSLTVHATPANIPNSIDVDVASLRIGDTVRVGDLKLPSGVTTEVDPEAPVAIAQPPQVTEEGLVSEAAAEGDGAEAGAEAEAPGAAAPPAEGGEG